MSHLLNILEALPVRNSAHSNWTSELPTPGTSELPVLPTQTTSIKTHVSPDLMDVLIFKKK